jgi:hypothetical protein
MTSFQTIVLKGQGHVEEGKLANEYDGLGEAIAYPGMGIQRDSSGDFVLGVGAADGNRGLVRIVMEDYLLGKTIEDPYLEGGTVRFYTPVPGDELLVLVSSGENLAIGDLLINDVSTGEWIKTTGSPEMEPFEVQESTGGALSTAALVRVKRL